jgi:hypothetical protein
MKTASGDEYVTRIWSTCPSMLKIHGIKGKGKDHSFIVEDCSLNMSSLLEHIQYSSKQLLQVSVAEKKDKKNYFGELYAHFLIECKTHTTHYVNIDAEIENDTNTSIARVALRCSKSVNKTKIIVLVEIASTLRKKETDPRPNEKPSTSTGQIKSGSKAAIQKCLNPADILRKLLEKLLIDGVDTVVVLTAPDQTMAFSTLFEKVSQRIKKVSTFVHHQFNRKYSIHGSEKNRKI